MAWAGDGTFLTVLDVIFCRIFGFVGDVAACTARGGGAQTRTHIPHEIMVVEPLLLPANDAADMLLKIIGSSKKPTARHLSVVQNAACYYQCHAVLSCCVVMLLALMESRQGNR